ncbi:MAG: transposase [Melioribacteraceae bacterium]|nr:transposase [Melioribacteraceae bacterium]
MHNRKRNRLNEFDYRQGYWYFVTICVKGMNTYFGRIEKAKMILNEYGKIVEEKLLWLKEQYIYVDIDCHVIMPNHIHAVIIIDPTGVGTSRDLSLQTKIKSLSELVGAFKTVSSKQIHQNGLTQFKWQRSFYDRIIRNEKELYRIRKYIEENPLRWEIGKGFTENLEL